jgi:hypothetical protein
VLAHARPVVGVPRHPAVELDQAATRHEPAEQAEVRPVAAARGVRLVMKVRVLDLGQDRVLDGGGTERVEGFLPDLLADMVEAGAHGAPGRWTERALSDAGARGCAGSCRRRGRMNPGAPPAV